jgi:hypothetical protein
MTYHRVRKDRKEVFMKNLNQINEIMESLRYATLKIDAEDIPYISEMMQIAVKFDSEYAKAYRKMHEIFKRALLSSESVEADIRTPEVEKTEEVVTETVTVNETPVVEETEEPDDTETDFREVTPSPEPEPEPEKTEAPIIFQHPDYPTIGAGTDGQVYSLKDGTWKKADTRSVYFPRKKDGTWGRVERQEILDLLNNHNTSAWDEPADAVEEKEAEYDRLPDGYFIHPTLRNLAANEDGAILKYNSVSKKWKEAETIEDGRGCRKVKGERIGTGKCVYECINRFTVKAHVRHLNGDSWDDAFSNLTVFGDKNYHKFQQRTYGEADVHEICEYICAHNGDVSNISRDSKGKYSIYYARKILTKGIHDNISDKYFGYTAGGSLKIYKEGDRK